MLARHVMDWLLACLNEAEADGYQQQDGLVIHSQELTFRLVSDTELAITVGEQEFRLKMRRLRASSDGNQQHQ